MVRKSFRMALTRPISAVCARRYLKRSVQPSYNYVTGDASMMKCCGRSNASLTLRSSACKQIKALHGTTCHPLLWALPGRLLIKKVRFENRVVIVGDVEDRAGRT